MKKLLFILFLSSISFGIESAYFTATAGTPLLSEYWTSEGSRLLVASRAHKLGAYINNTTASTIGCFLTHSSASSAPNRATGTVSEEIFLPTNTAAVLPNIYTSRWVFCRSTTGANITSGSVAVHVW